MRLNKAKKRLQIEVDNLNAIFDRERQEIIELEVRVKKLHKLLHDEKNIATHLQSEKETLITTNRTLIKKIEDATEKIIQRDSQLVEAERLRKSLKDELDRLGDDKDRLDKLCSDLQNTNSTISHQCHEQKIVIEALEEDLNHKDDEIRGIEIQLKALRDTHKKDLEARDGKIDDLKKALLKAERDLKAALEDEAQKREAILSQKRILETTIATLQVEMDNLKRQLEDAKRKIDQLTEQNKLIPGLQRDLDDALAANDILQKELADSKWRSSTSMMPSLLQIKRRNSLKMKLRMLWKNSGNKRSSLKHSEPTINVNMKLSWLPFKLSWENSMLTLSRLKRGTANWNVIMKMHW